MCWAAVFQATLGAARHRSSHQAKSLLEMMASHWQLQM